MAAAMQAIKPRATEMRADAIDTDIEVREDSSPFDPVDKLQSAGINAADVKKLRDAGFHTLQSIVCAMRKDLLVIKGFSDLKVDKIMEVSRRSTSAGFVTCSQLATKQMHRFKLSTGASKLDQLLGGGVESCAITELFGEFRCGKTQLCQSLSVMAQFPASMGGANGKVVYIDTEGKFRPERLRQFAESKGVSPEAAMDNIVYARCYTSEHLVQLLVEAGSLMVSDEELNVAVLLTNQVTADLGGGCGLAPSLPKPVGGHILAHFATTRVFLRKGRAEQRVATLYDSPWLPETECVFEICSAGVRDGGD